jgi:hypothetical protein
MSSGSTLGVNAGVTWPASTVNNVNAALQDSYPTMPYNAGNWYFGPLPAGTTAANAASGAMIAMPFYVGNPYAFTSMGVFCVTMTSALSCNFGIYAANSTGSTTVPTGAALVSGTGSSGFLYASNTSGLNTIALSVTLPIGWYWLAFLANSTMSAYGQTGNELVPFNTLRTGQTAFGTAVTSAGAYRHSQTFGSLPATFPTSALSVINGGICIGLKA